MTTCVVKYTQFEFCTNQWYFMKIDKIIAYVTCFFVVAIFIIQPSYCIALMPLVKSLSFARVVLDVLLCNDLYLFS